MSRKLLGRLIYVFFGHKIATCNQSWLDIINNWKQNWILIKSLKIWLVLNSILQGVQQNCSHLVICSFAGFYSCKLQKLGGFWKIQEICYMIGTRILKIDLEIAEIIEVKVATFSIKIIFLPLCNSKMSISKWWLPTLTSIISTISKSIFKILVPIM